MTREDEIFRKIEQGDSGGLDELVSLYYPEILRYCRWHTPDQATAEDAAQETFLKAVRHFDRYVHKGRFKAFLYQIAANTCVDMWRKRNQRPCRRSWYIRNGNLTGPSRRRISPGWWNGCPKAEGNRAAPVCPGSYAAGNRRCPGASAADGTIAAARRIEVP